MTTTPTTSPALNAIANDFADLHKQLLPLLTFLESAPDLLGSAQDNLVGGDPHAEEFVGDQLLILSQSSTKVWQSLFDVSSRFNRQLDNFVTNTGQRSGQFRNMAATSRKRLAQAEQEARQREQAERDRIAQAAAEKARYAQETLEMKARLGIA